MALAMSSRSAVARLAPSIEMSSTSRLRRLEMRYHSGIARPEHGWIARGELVGFDEVILGVAGHRGGLRMFEDARMAGHQHDEEQRLLAFFGGD